MQTSMPSENVSAKVLGSVCVRSEARALLRLSLSVNPNARQNDNVWTFSFCRAR